MTDAVILDSGPLGLLTNPSPTPDVINIRQWLTDLLANGRRVVLPEIIDYEIRREFIRGNFLQSLYLLDLLSANVEYLPLTTATMREAAFMWAQVRNAGKQTASNQKLDIDVILAAQASQLQVSAIVATGNAAHLSLFLPAADWTAITP